MADFSKALPELIRLEGGYKFHEVDGDRGLATYAGISWRSWPAWEGWEVLNTTEDSRKMAPLVERFYKENFWDRFLGDLIGSQRMAEALLSLTVLMGSVPVIKRLQGVLGAKQDGIMGDATLQAVNEASEHIMEEFLLYNMAAVCDIVANDPEQLKFLRGWKNRIMELC